MHISDLKNWIIVMFISDDRRTKEQDESEAETEEGGTRRSTSPEGRGQSIVCFFKGEWMGWFRQSFRIDADVDLRKK